jgi:endonuclease/exonuclease/phosphatase (EEP) superfamily protein YafD
MPVATQKLQPKIKAAHALSTQLMLLSYNLRFHTAYPEVKQLAQQYPLDIVCLQECHTTELDQNIGDLTLAVKSDRGELGLAMYCRTDRFKVIRTFESELPKSLYEQARPDDRVRLIIAEVAVKATKERLFIGCVHATHLIASNWLRRQQLAHTFSLLDELAGNSSIILAGDYNYPLFQQKLYNFIQSYNYRLISVDQPTYRDRLFAGKYDFASVRNVQGAQAVVLPQNKSDHMPVLLITQL